MPHSVPSTVAPAWAGDPGQRWWEGSPIVVRDGESRAVFTAGGATRFDAQKWVRDFTQPDLSPETWETMWQDLREWSEQDWSDLDTWLTSPTGQIQWNQTITDFLRPAPRPMGVPATGPAIPTSLFRNDGGGSERGGDPGGTATSIGRGTGSLAGAFGLGMSSDVRGREAAPIGRLGQLGLAALGMVPGIGPITTGIALTNAIVGLVDAYNQNEAARAVTERSSPALTAQRQGEIASANEVGAAVAAAVAAAAAVAGSPDIAEEGRAAAEAAAAAAFGSDTGTGAGIGGGIGGPGGGLGEGGESGGGGRGESGVGDMEGGGGGGGDTGSGASGGDSGDVGGGEGGGSGSGGGASGGTGDSDSGGGEGGGGGGGGGDGNGNGGGNGGFHRGGLVRKGPPKGPKARIVAHEGEFVINARATKRFHAQLVAINKYGQQRKGR